MMGIFELGGVAPEVSPEAYIAPTAVLVGDVRVGRGASVWFGAILRGDEGTIVVGDESNVQDCTVVHGGANIGPRTTVGHACILHGCTLEGDTLVGEGSIVLDGAMIGRGSFVAAGSLVLGHRMYRARSWIGGHPASVHEHRDPSDIPAEFRDGVDYYTEKGRQYRHGLAEVGDGARSRVDFRSPPRPPTG